MIKVSDLFDVVYGVNLEFQNMEVSENGIPFVSRTEKNNGVVAFVKKIDGIKPNPKNTISVACGGSVMESFLQTNEYYSGRDLFYLKPKIELTEKQMLYYCMCLRANKYRYSYGRQANKTLANILIPSPEEIPDYIVKVKIKEPSKEPASNAKIDLNVSKWKSFEIGKVFKLERGTEIIGELEEGKNPLISASETQNGVAKFVKNGHKMFSSSLTIANNGSVGASFFQDNDFFATPDVTILTNNKINKYNAMFISTIISKERYRFSYGRKWGNEKMKKSQIKLPTTPQGEPDWEFMENYIKSLPYSISL